MIDLRDPKEYAERFLSIRDKEARLISFRYNEAQRRFHTALEKQRKAGKPMRAIILKARQMGFSTYVESRIFAEAATHFNTAAMIVAHDETATSNIFKMSRLFLDSLPEEIRPKTKASNANEIVFENPDKDITRKAADPGLRSSIRCITAGGRGVGRSFTLRALHISEYAFWPGKKNEILTGLLQAVPDKPGTMVIIESTANGYNEFYELWQRAVKGESDYIPFFAPWWWLPEYSMRPEKGFKPTPEEAELAKRYKLTRGQLAWRRHAIADYCGGDENLFRQEYPANPDEAFIFSGSPVFDMEAIIRRKEEIKPPLTTGDFGYHLLHSPEGYRIEKAEWTADRHGAIKIFKQPEKGRPYVIGGDTAGDGSDMFVGQVLDNITGEQVAVLRHQFDEDRYADQLYCLGRYYNDALIGVEVNFSTHPVKRLQELGYPKLFVRRREDSFTGGITNSYGFKTTSITRPLIIGQLVGIFRDQPGLINDRTTLEEMQTFFYNERWKPEALAGKHDDTVMALAIAYYIRPEQRMTVEEGEQPFGDHWRQDMWDDYHKADEAGKAHLREIWRHYGEGRKERR